MYLGVLCFHSLNLSNVPPREYLEILPLPEAVPLASSKLRPRFCLSRDAQDSPPTKNCPTSDVSSAQVEKPRASRCWERLSTPITTWRLWLLLQHVFRKPYFPATYWLSSCAFSFSPAFSLNAFKICGVPIKTTYSPKVFLVPIWFSCSSEKSWTEKRVW